jgi:2-C-methyl-D-erythritol 4-phosphate cytidylyltransferase/2-C-methyl-D-erythritol 2,4-cyclodiphosphate synthase
MPKTKRRRSPKIPAGASARPLTRDLRDLRVLPSGATDVCFHRFPMPVGVIIVAGGRGQRVGGPIPKQLIDLGGRTVLQRSVAAFDAHPSVARIVVVLPADLVASGARLAGTSSRCTFVAGGERRQDSVRAGLDALADDADVVLIHDAARPFVDGALIDRVIEAARRTGAALPAVMARDTVKRVPATGSLVAETIPRGEIWLAQTPQGFTREVLVEAVAHGAGGFEATDEAMLVERAGRPVEIVAGEARNFKITTAEDVMTARTQFARQPRVGTGYDLHRLVEGRPLILAGEVIPFDKGPLGHSDGDVVCHALADAMFGAAAMGDIGQHFSNTDARWKDVAGLDLLGRAVQILGDAGWRVASADITVVLERPKLVAHLPAIRQSLAAVLGLEAGLVSVKGKTNEGVDAVGRGEAIAAHAVAVVVEGRS